MKLLVHYDNSYEKQNYLNYFNWIALKNSKKNLPISEIYKDGCFDIFSNPFIVMNINKIPEKFQMKIKELESKKDHKMKFMKLSKIDYYNYNLDSQMLLQLTNNAKKFHCLEASNNFVQK